MIRLRSAFKLVGPTGVAADCITTASLDDTAAIRALAAEVLDGLGLE